VKQLLYTVTMQKPAQAFHGGRVTPHESKTPVVHKGMVLRNTSRRNGYSSAAVIIMFDRRVLIFGGVAKSPPISNKYSFVIL
jgi:hypothetical protein